MISIPSFVYREPARRVIIVMVIVMVRAFRHSGNGLHSELGAQRTDLSSNGHGRLWPNRLWPIFRPTLANRGLDRLWPNRL